MKPRTSRRDTGPGHSPPCGGGSGLPVSIPGGVRLAFEQAVRGGASTPLARRIRALLQRRVGIVYRKCLWAVQREPR